MDRMIGYYGTGFIWLSWTPLSPWGGAYHIPLGLSVLLGRIFRNPYKPNKITSKSTHGWKHYGNIRDNFPWSGQHCLSSSVVTSITLWWLSYDYANIHDHPISMNIQWSCHPWSSPVVTAVTNDDRDSVLGHFLWSQWH